MCIICIEFNKYRDIRDAAMMIKAARRETTIIPEEHLVELERQLADMDEEDVKPVEVP
jgi:hypothetical protein